MDEITVPTIETVKLPEVFSDQEMIELLEKTKNLTSENLKVEIVPTNEMKNEFFKEFLDAEDPSLPAKNFENYSYEDYNESISEISDMVNPGIKYVMSNSAILAFIKSYLPSIIASSCSSPLDIQFEVDFLKISQIFVIPQNIDEEKIEIRSNVETNSIILTFSDVYFNFCLLYTSPSPRDLSTSRMPSSA